MSRQSETTEPEKNGDDKDETKDLQKPEVITNGKSAEGQENGEVIEKVDDHLRKYWEKKS